MKTRQYLRIYIPLVATVLLTLAVASGGCEILDPNPGPQPITGTPGDSIPVDATPATVQRGITLYAQNCARCHGDSAQGSPIWEPSIQGRVGIHTVVRDGRRAMPAFRNLSDSAIASIELYLRSFPIDFTAKSRAELYTIFCSGCHGDSGVGSTGDAAFPGNIQGYEPIHDIVRNGRGDMPAMVMADNLIDSVQKFLLDYKVDYKALNGVDYYAYKCAGCHGAAGEGTKRGFEVRDPHVGYATWVIRHGRPGAPVYKDSMPVYAVDSLSDTQLTQMLSWLRTASNPPSGRALYNRFCASCHGFDALGGRAQKPLRFKGADDMEDAVYGGKGGDDYGNEHKFMPARSITEISPEEIGLIATYVRSMK